MSGDFKKEMKEMRLALIDKYGANEIVEKPLISITSHNLNSLYFDTILEELKHGRINYVDVGSFAGSYRLEFEKASLCITHPTTRPLAPLPREGVIVTTNNEKIDGYFLDYLIDGSLKPNEHYKYSSWIVGIPKFTKAFPNVKNTNLPKPVKKVISSIPKYVPLKHEGIPRGTRENQLENCVKHFVNNGYGTNHCAIVIGGDKSLKRYWWKHDGETKKGSSECLRQIMMYIRDDKLDFHTTWRSWDLVAGLPENLGGITKLMEYTSEWINATKKPEQPEVKPGKLYAESPGLHIYEHNLDLAKMWMNLE